MERRSCSACTTTRALDGVQERGGRSAVAGKDAGGATLEGADWSGNCARRCAGERGDDVWLPRASALLQADLAPGQNDGQALVRYE